MAGGFKGHFEVRGQGEVVLCIPGFASGNWIFSRLAAPLEDRFRLVLPDNRGMGRSPPALEGYRMEELAQDALDLMDDLGCERFHVIGLSMGGFVAQLLALMVPQRVAGLVLMCTTSGGQAYRDIFPSLSEEQVRAIYRLSPRDRVAAALSPQICPLLQSHFPQVYDYVMRERVQDPADPQQVMHQFFAVQGFMEQPLPLDRITSPTLILAGEKDLLVPLANAQGMAAAIPQAQVRVMAATDHLFFLENIPETVAAIADFLSMVSQARPVGTNH